MKKVINILGTLILTVMIISVPSLCTCSYLLNWDGFIKWLSTVLTLAEMIVIGGILYAEVEKEDGNNDL